MITTTPARFMATPLLLLAVVLMGAYTGFTAFQRDLAFTNVQTELSFWGRDRYQPEANTIKRTGQALDALLQSAPNHPEYLALQANFAAWQAYWSANMDDRASFNKQAVQSQYQALQMRPAHRHSWSKMVEYASRTTAGEAMLIEAQAHLQALSVAKVPPLPSSPLPELQPHPI